MAIEFEVKLSDGVTKVAIDAAQQIDVLGKQLRALQNAMVKTNALGDSEALDKIKAKYGKLNAEFERLGGPAAQAAKVQANAQKQLEKEMTKSAREQEKAQAKVARVQAKLAKESAKAAQGQNKLAEAFTNANQPGGMLGQLVKALGPEMMAAAAAAVAAAAAIAGLAAAFIGAIKVAGDFAQQQRGLENTFNALGRGTTTGKQMTAMFDELGKVLPMSREQMAELNKAMMQGGVTDMPRLMQATKAAAAANALMGDTSGKAGEKISGLVVEINKAIKLRQGIGDIATTLEGTGISAEEVAAKMGIGVRQLKMMAASGVQLNKIGNAIQDALIRKGIGPMRDMMSTWDMVSKRIQGATAKLFGGISETKGFKMFSEQLVRLLDSFDSSAGRTQGKVTSAFDAMFTLAARLLREFHLGMLRAEISMLRIQLALIPVRKLFGKLNDIVDLAEVAMVGFRIAVDATVASLKSAVPGLGAFSAAFGALELVGEYTAQGYAKGIKKGTPKVKAAAQGMGTTAKSSISQVLQMFSPSRVFIGLGAYTAAGFALGMQTSTPKVLAASKGMAETAYRGTQSAPITPSPRASTSKGGVNVTLASGAIQITSNGGSPVDLLEEAVVSLFERVALTQGVA